MIKKILVPNDASEPSKKALKTAMTIARKYNARIELLHVVQNTGDFYSILDTLGYEVSEDELNQYGEPIINKTMEGMDADLELQKRVRFGNPAFVILEEIEKEGIDIVIIGSQGHSALAGSLMRSVSQHIVHHSKCPMLIVK